MIRQFLANRRADRYDSVFAAGANCTMTPLDFITKWRRIDLSERSACQSHFHDLCDMLGQDKPTDADPTGEWYPCIVPKDAESAALLKRRTLTNLYSDMPTWLKNPGAPGLDEAVFAAYPGAPGVDLSDDELLARPLALNLERATAERDAGDA